MTISESAVRRVIELAIEDKHDDAEQEMERIVQWDEDLIRRIVREEVDRAAASNEDRIQRISFLVSAVGALVGVTFTFGMAFVGHVAFDITIPALETLIASLALGVLGGVTGRRVAK